MGLEGILKKMVSKKASDLILKVGNSAYFRINGELFKEGPELTEKDLKGFFEEVKNCCESHLEEQNEQVLSLGIEGLGRFRVTLYRQRGTLVIVIRAVNTKIPSFDELHLPSKVLTSLCREKRGLVLVTGTTGSGKSTTVASMIEYINNNMAKHIVTLEDPIEFLFKDKNSILCQREIRIDSDSFQKALEYSMLQTPDTIFIGDIRNMDIMSTAITAAETGQLVIANLHTINAIHTIE
ncbi:MAG: ATPase, T2SS/T4P/T4SS family, partial [Candidatus Omnitrophota bacterium]|nr:ATPase, T2SS/T4P/T4SS family [Candidatus Omnitrophota bacterium]